jgi:hypothetical protein
MLRVTQAALWCSIAEAISGGGPTPETSFRLQSVDDGLWYDISDFELSAGNAQVDFGQVAQAAGTQPYRVIVNLTDGLKYKFVLFGSAGSITGGYDGTGPTLEAETPTIFIDPSLREYKLNFVTDGVITFQLDQV